MASTLCKYDLRKGDLFVLNWARVRRVRHGSISSELLMCGRSMRSIFLFPLVDRCIETIYSCIWHMFVFMSVVVTVRGYVCCVAAVVKDSFFSKAVLTYVVCLCKGCGGCCVFCLYCDACGCILWQFSMLRSAWLLSFYSFIQS